MKKLWFSVLAVLLAGSMILGSADMVQAKGADHMADEAVKANPTAVVETNYGTIELELYADKTPVTVENFIKLAKSGFYDGVIFHRVIDGFMIQGGDPTGTGMGGPGYTIPDEFDKTLTFKKEGVLAMANTGRPHTGGSQFFITLAATPWLNQHHTIFGKVVKGMDVVKKIGKAETDFNDRPLKDAVMQKVTIVGDVQTADGGEAAKE